MLHSSRIVSAGKNTKSLRTTIPESLCGFLMLDKEDLLSWKPYERDGKRFILISKTEI